MRERRRHPRKPVVDPVLVRRGRRMDATVGVDVSLGGILIDGPQDLELGEQVVLTFDGADRPATVVRITPTGYRALIFD